MHLSRYETGLCIFVTGCFCEHVCVSPLYMSVGNVKFNLYNQELTHHPLSIAQPL
jgi:hypothetical protein